MKMYRCLYPNCGILLTESGYCQKHKRPETKSSAKPFAKARRSNESLYHSPRWRALRKEIIALHPYCKICGVRDDLQVHHIKPPRGNEVMFFDPANLMVVCSGCHRYLTVLEITERKKRK